MSINSNTGTFISLSDAKAYVTGFKNLATGMPKGYFFGSDKLTQILAQTGCIGIRFYSGYDTVNKVYNIVAVGVDENEHDMTQGLILEKASLCPPNCDTSSSLNC